MVEVFLKEMVEVLFSVNAEICANFCDSKICLNRALSFGCHGVLRAL
jgi:hypothetical protein